MNPTKRTDTAFRDWDKRWQTAEGRKDWLVPEDEVVSIVSLLQEREIKKVLDLGCGVGRHSLYLAQADFSVSAIDASPAGVDLLTRRAAAEGLSMDIRCAEMTRLPYEDRSMEYVLAWNVIYHGDHSIVARVISEIQRVLIPGGLFQGTMLSKRHKGAHIGRLISKNTYIQNNGGEKLHPHYFCNTVELIGLMTGFELMQLRDAEHREPGSFHWHFLAEKR